MKMKAKAILFVTGLFVSTYSSAAVNCGGKLERVYVDSSGQVIIWPTWSESYHTICSVNGDWNSISRDTCKSWLSVALALKISGTNARVRYSSLDNCSNIPTYGNAPKPNYLMADL